MAGNENNPYALDQAGGPKSAANQKTKPGDPGHKVTLADMREANVDGHANPATMGQNLGDADIMSGKVDRAGVPMTRAVAKATEVNDKILNKEEVEAGGRIMIHTEDGKEFPHPPNTPAI
jgi:hypothetical protein